MSPTSPKGKRYVCVLHGINVGVFDSVADLPVSEGEQAILKDGFCYLYCPHGYSRTKLTNKLFEKKFGAPATTRNWRTVWNSKNWPNLDPRTSEIRLNY